MRDKKRHKQITPEKAAGQADQAAEKMETAMEKSTQALGQAKKGKEKAFAVSAVGIAAGEKGLPLQRVVEEATELAEKSEAVAKVQLTIAKGVMR